MELFGVLLAALGLLTTIIIFWINKERPLQYRILNALLALIVVAVILIIIAVLYSDNGEPYKPTEPTETTPPETTAPPTTEPPVPETTLILDNMRIGDTITFGTYEQDNTTKKAEEIEWLVLAKEEDRILVLSKYGLDSQLFNKTYKPVTWETCTIRDWCKGFYDKAFNAEEQKLILLSTLQPGTCPARNCDKGNATQDHVFLLSLDEVNTYIKENGQVDADALLCRPTEYAVQEAGAYKNGTGHGWWWLRTSTNNNCYACSVNSDGSLDLSNGKVNSPNAAVRPAMWISLE